MSKEILFMNGGYQVSQKNTVKPNKGTNYKA